MPARRCAPIAKANTAEEHARNRRRTPPRDGRNASRRLRTGFGGPRRGQDEDQLPGGRVPQGPAGQQEPVGEDDRPLPGPRPTRTKGRVGVRFGVLRCLPSGMLRGGPARCTPSTQHDLSRCRRTLGQEVSAKPRKDASVSHERPHLHLWRNAYIRLCELHELCSYMCGCCWQVLVYRQSGLLRPPLAEWQRGGAEARARLCTRSGRHSARLQVVYLAGRSALYSGRLASFGVCAPQACYIKDFSAACPFVQLQVVPTSPPGASTRSEAQCKCHVAGLS